ncbi:MAG: hypothetical protein COV74_07285 [Candidatus Omnitrophica bacterium CG11_big_fil_rev_8_21_14_0_20_45_26]|uniref:HTH tetR-type domain-containing protein n=1 Tax=Candidatus Abzuiibacterium crystallinum TaxID=1974748 RepID=A0A2H0LN66_9BACT|nr:MAG: hypothetical protein COV74_07285 [Candidatus Omnitrophica bacterium CG11_big_fil_rev_8_21_14_0_20_45_26]PIW65502.1 MAG: hypothetical protein COW12_01545 [Candidatus Omnitrophica bacterium CG12_big_fil_rev_8_21_14_0_65_45_16]
MGRRNKFKILDATVKLMGEQGFSRVSVDDILKESQVQKSNFYYHFKSKEDIAIAALSEMLAKVDDEIWQGILQDKALSPKDRLEKLVAHLIETFERNQGKMGDPFGNLVAEMGDHNQRFQEKLNDYFIRYSSYLESVIEEGIEEDEFRRSLIPREAAEAILCQIQGAYLLARAYQDPGTLRRNIEFLINIICAD